MEPARSPSAMVKGIFKKLKSRRCGAKRHGTTVVGLKYGDSQNGGVVLGSDSQASGSAVKIQKVAKKVYLCLFGDAQGGHSLLNSIDHSLRRRRQSGETTSISEIARIAWWIMLQYKGKLDCGAIIGGWEPNIGPELYLVDELKGVESIEVLVVEGSGSDYTRETESWVKRSPPKFEDEAMKLVREIVDEAIRMDHYSGMPIYTVAIREEKVVRQVVDENGSEYEKRGWGWKKRE